MTDVVQRADVALLSRPGGKELDSVRNGPSGLLTNGLADIFALRNHGMKALLPGVLPERAFAGTYVFRDMTYALDLAREAGLATPGTNTARALLERTIAQGHGNACRY